MPCRPACKYRRGSPEVALCEGARHGGSGDLPLVIDGGRLPITGIPVDAIPVDAILVGMILVDWRNPRGSTARSSFTAYRAIWGLFGSTGDLPANQHDIRHAKKI